MTVVAQLDAAPSAVELERVRDELARAVRRRQWLREAGGLSRTLEQNRLQIVALQQRMSELLIATHRSARLERDRSELEPRLSAGVAARKRA